MAICSSDDDSQKSQALLPEIVVPNTNPTKKNHGNNNTAISSITSISTSQPVSTVDKSCLVHPYYLVLNGGRRSLLKNMQFRIHLVNSNLALATASYLPYDLCIKAYVKRWFSIHTAYLKAPRKWNRAVMAQAICEFDLIMEEAKTMVASSTTSDDLVPPAIREFYAYMEDVRDVATIVENEPIVSQKSRIGSQSTGKRVQDCLDMSEVTRDKLDISNCANCKHNFVLPIGLKQLEINHNNDNVNKEYCEAMYAYNHKSKSRKGDKKPKMGRSISMKLACLCTRMHYLNRIDGVGCLKCKWSCIESTKQAKMERFFLTIITIVSVLSANVNIPWFTTVKKKRRWLFRQKMISFIHSIPNLNRRLMDFLDLRTPSQI